MVAVAGFEPASLPALRY